MGKKRRASENSSPDSSGSNPPSARPEIASASSGSLRALGTGDDQQDEPGQTMMNQRAQHDDFLPNKKKTTSPRANGRNQEPDADNGKVSDKPEGDGGIERAGSVSGSSADQDTICRQNREMVSVSATTAGAVMKDAPYLGGKDDGRRPNLSAVGDDLMELSLSSRWRTFEHDETLPQRTLEANTTAMMMSLERHVAETEESGWTETPPTWQETAQRVVNRYNDESIAEKTDPNGYYDTISDMNLNPSYAAQPYIVAKYPAVEDIALDIDITASTRDSIKEEQESLNSHRNSSEKSGSGDDDAGDRSKNQDCDESVIDNDDDLSNDYPLYYDDPSVDVPSSAEIPKGNATTSSVREQLHEGAYFEQKGEDEDISARNDVRRMTDASRPDGNGMNSDISDFHAVPAKQSVAAETDKNCNAVPRQNLGEEEGNTTKFEPDTDHSYIEDEGEDEGGLSMRHYIDLGAESDPSESSHQQYYHEDSSDTASVAALLRASSKIQSEPPVIDGTTHYNDYRGADLPGGRREQLLNTLLLGENPNNNEEKRPSLGSGEEDLFGNLAGEGKGKDDRLLTQTNKKESLLRDLLSKPLSKPGAMEPDVTESEAGEEQLAVPDDIDAPGTDGFNNLDLKDWSKDISLGSNTSDVYTEHSIAHDITQNGDNNDFLVKKDRLLSLLAPPSEVSTGGASSNIQSDIDPKENPAGGSLEFLAENHANVNSGSALLAKKDRFLVPLAPPSELSVGGESSVVRSDIGLEDKPAGSTDDVPVNNHADIIIGGSALLAKKDRFLVPLAPPSELSAAGASSDIQSDIDPKENPAGGSLEFLAENHANVNSGSALLAKKDRFLVPLAPPSELSVGGESSAVRSDIGLEDKPAGSTDDVPVNNHADIIIGGSALLAKKDRFLVPLAPPSELSVGGESSVVRSDTGLEDKPVGSSGDMLAGSNASALLAKKDRFLVPLAPPSELSVGGESSVVRSDIGLEDKPAGSTDDVPVNNHADIIIGGSALLAKKDRFLVPLAPPSELSAAGASSDIQSDIDPKENPAGGSLEFLAENHANVNSGSALLAKKDRFLVPLAPPSELSVGGESSAVRSDIGFEDKPAGSTDDVPVNNHADIIIGGSALLAKKDRFLVPLAPPSELSVGGESSVVRSDTGLEDKALGRATHPKHIFDDDYLGIRHRSDDDDDDFESSKSSGNDYIQRPSKLQAEVVQKSIRDDLLEPVQQINDVEEDDNIGNERSESASASIGAAPMHEDDDDDSAFESVSSEDTRSGREQVNSAHNEHITEDDRGRYWHQQRDHVLTHSDDNGTEEGYVAGKNKKKNRSEAYLETIEKDENCSDRHGSESSATDSLAPSKDNPPLSARKEKGGSIDQRYENRYDSNGNSDRKTELSTKAQETERNPRDGDEDNFLSKAQMQSEKEEMVSLTGRSLLSDESEDPNVVFADEEQGLRKRGESHVDVFVSSVYQPDNDDSHFNDGWERDDISGRSGARPALAQNSIAKMSTFFQWKRAGHWSIFFVVVIIVVAITGTMIPTKSGQSSLIVDPSIISSPPSINPNPNDITPTASPTANENEEDIPDPREWAQVGGALQGEGNDDLAGFAVDVSKDGRSAVMGE